MGWGGGGGGGGGAGGEVTLKVILCLDDRDDGRCCAGESAVLS